MRRIRYAIFLIVYILLVQGFIIGCNDIKEKDNYNKEDNDIESEVDKNELILEEGAYVEKKGDNYSIYNDNHLTIMDTERVVTNYNKEMHTYIFNKDGVLYVNYKDEDYKISDEKVYNPKISPNGEYVLFFTKDEFLIPKIFDIKNNSVKEINNKAIISGQFVDWLDNNIAFYGVDNEEKVTGIFVYDIEAKTERCIYKVEGGFIEYLESMGKEIVIVERQYTKDILIKKINKEGVVTELYDKCKEVYDIEINEEGLFILGRINDNLYSLYKVKDNVAYRLVYDFPQNIYFEKGISKTESGEILFIGSSKEGEQKIYSYSNGIISDIGNSSGDFYFIDIN